MAEKVETRRNPDRGQVNMEIVLKNGKKKTFGAPRLSQCQNEAMQFCKENGLNFRNPKDVVSWEAV